MEDRISNCGATDVNIDLKIILPAVVITCERPAEEAGAVIAYGGLDNPRPLDDSIDNFESSVAEGVIAVDEPVEEGGGRDGVVGGKVEDGGVALAAGDLEIDCDDEGFERAAEGVGAAEGGGDAVVRTGEYVVEAGGGAEPVDACGLEEPVAGGGFLAAREVGAAADSEEVAGGRGPAIGSGVEVDVAEGSAVD